MRIILILIISTLLVNLVFTQSIEIFEKFTDSRDGKTYKTVKIGEQVWFAENLNYNTNISSWCYDEDPENCEKYGRLYDWETAITVCPPGWKLPSNSDFETLLTDVGGSGSNAYNALIPDGNSGFSALFGGWHHYAGFNYIDYIGYFWSDSSFDDDFAWYLFISSINNIANMNNYDLSLGLSVRCVQE